MEPDKCLQDYLTISASLLANDLIPEDAVKGLGLDRILSFDDHIVKVTTLCMSILGQNKS